jgi:hypothetical protein
MELKEHSETWPAIRHSDVADFCRTMRESIVALERAFVEGDLSNRIELGSFEHVLGPEVFEAYKKLGNSVLGPQHPLRVDAVGADSAAPERSHPPSNRAGGASHAG